jgi:hypothetical protein
MAGNEMDLLKQAAHTLMARFVMAILPLLGLFGGGPRTHARTETTRFPELSSGRKDDCYIVCTDPFFNICGQCSSFSCLWSLFGECLSSCLAHAFNVKVDEGSRLQSGLIKAAIYDWCSHASRKAQAWRFFARAGCKKKNSLHPAQQYNPDLSFPFPGHKYT